MADPWELILTAVGARALLATPSDKELEIIVDVLYTIPQESRQYKAARAIYDLCVSRFPNCLILKLLKVYRFSSNEIFRLRSIYLLSEILTELRAKRFEFSLVALYETKPILISCLKFQNGKRSDSTILRIIVDLIGDNGGVWEEMSDCILSLVSNDPIRAFNVFIQLPSSIFGEFVYRFLQKFLDEVYKVLLHPEGDRVEDWVLALKSAVKMGILLMDSEMRFDLTRDIVHIVLKSADEVVRIRMEEEFLRKGVQSLEKYLADDAKLFKWNSDQCRFVAEFAFRISEIGIFTEEGAKKIYEMVTELENYVHSSAFELSPSRDGNQYCGVEYECELYKYLEALSVVEIVRLVALSRIDDRSREVAIIRLHDLLCAHTFGISEISVSEIREIQPLLISCISEVGIPESTFKILGQVVFHVAHELSSYQEDNWFGLWDYIARECKTIFTKTVYIFQCLTMRLDDKEFVIHAIKNLLPEIHRNLNPPRELLEVDNSCWVLAFVGAFCAAIHLIEIPNRAEAFKEIVYKMIDSAKEVVERGMEVELVRRAFLDIESIVEKQVDCYTTNDYRFVKGLIWRLYAIKGMSMESKNVLWRINVVLESVQDVKELPKSELDWLNQPETLGN